MLRVDEVSAEFSPEILQILREAMDEAWRHVKLSDVNGNVDGARAVLAEHMLALAKRGERDPKRLIEAALSRLSL
jgi:hypothetical protein